MDKSRLQQICLAVLFLCISTPVLAKESISIGIFPRNNYADTIRMFMPLSKYLSNILNRQVKIKTTKTYAEFWDNILNNKYDLVHMNQYQYLLAHKQTKYKIFLMNEEFGRSTLRSVIIARKDSGIHSIEDLKGKNIIFGGNKTAMMSYLIPQNMLKMASINSSDYTTLFARNPPNALMATYLKQADACGVGDVLLKSKQIQQRIKTNELHVIATSDPVAHLAWVTSPNIQEELKKQIEDSLLKLKYTSQGKVILTHAKLTGFMKAVHSDYEPLEKYLETID